MRSNGQFACKDLDQRVHTLIGFPERFDFRYGMEDSRVVPAIVESSNLRETPSPHMPGEIHRHLPTEARTLHIARNTARSEVSRDNLLDSRQRDAPDHCPVRNGVHSQPPLSKTALARSTHQPVPSWLILAGHSGHSARTRSSQRASLSRNLRGREYSELPS